MDSSNTWYELDVNWEEADFVWHDIEIIEEVISNINGGLAPVQAVDHLSDRDKKRFITLTTYVLDKEIVQRKEKKKVKLTTDNIMLTINELSEKFKITAKII